MDGRETVKRRKDKILGHKEQKIIASREERKDAVKKIVQWHALYLRMLMHWEKVTHSLLWCGHQNHTV